MAPAFENEFVYIEVEPSEIPWLKIFAREECKEFSECSAETRVEIFELLHRIEREMLDYFQPTKINIASFANYLPKVHWHIMARFSDDSWFPEPVWGQKQRDARLDLPQMEPFIERLRDSLQQR